MTNAIILWFAKAMCLIALTLIAYVISPILACFIVYADEESVTGFPSLHPGMPRAFLIPSLRIWQTPDAPVDEWWFGDYYPAGFLKTHFTQSDYDRMPVLRWWIRVLWLCRNAAYGFGAKMGFDATGLNVERATVNESLWKSGMNCTSTWVFTNAAGQTGFCYRAQLYYFGAYCLEMYLGYKLLGDTIQGKKLVALQVTPFRKYPS